MSRPFMFIVVILVALSVGNTACELLGLQEDDCGNGVLDEGEQCDGKVVHPSLSASANCRFYGGRDADIPCTSSCELDFEACQRFGTCGDGQVQFFFEECDTLVPDGMGCPTYLGYYSGELLCSVDCRLDYALCAFCGDNMVSPEHGEVCDTQSPRRCSDLGYGSGLYHCVDCSALDVSACDPARYQSYGSFHRVTTAVSDGAGGFWRAGFVTGGIAGGFVNAQADCPAKFNALAADHTTRFLSATWDPTLWISDCHDLFLQRFDGALHLLATTQFGTLGADIPAFVLAAPDGRVGVFAWHVLGPLKRDGVRVAVRMHVFDAAGRALRVKDLHNMVFPLENMSRLMVQAGMIGSTWHLLLDLRPVDPLPRLAIFSGGFDDEPVTESILDPETLHPGVKVFSMEVGSSGWFGDGAFLVSLRTRFMAPEGETKPENVTLLRLQPGSGACTVPWIRTFDKTSRLLFSEPESPGRIWVFEDRSDIHEPSREWRITAEGAENIVGDFRTQFSDKPLHAFHHDDQWLLSGKGPPGVTIEWVPACTGFCEDTAWQVVSTRVSYPSVGRGWNSGVSPPGSLLQVRQPDGKWIWTGTFDLDRTSGQFDVLSYIIPLPNDPAF